eukprot:351851-Chlamydomonas_euryale.AAC.1
MHMCALVLGCACGCPSIGVDPLQASLKCGTSHLDVFKVLAASFHGRDAQLLKQRLRVHICPHAHTCVKAYPHASTP